MNDDRLISLNAAIDALREVIVPAEDIGFGDELTDGYNDGIDMAITVVSGLPPVDAVPVVRCRDCEYWDTIPRSTVAPLHHQCKETRLMTTGIWYCPLGKRKDSDGNG